MREDHHTFEPHTETADDHFCDRCFGHHHWEDGCPETDDDDDEPLDLIPARGQLEVKIDGCGPVSHTVKAYRIPSSATDAEVKAAIRYWMPREFCQHEHDCCGRYYPNEGQLIGRTYADDGQDVVFVLRTYTMNV